MESHSRGNRTIKMYDITGKKLSNTSIKKVNSYIKKGLGEWIIINESFKLNHEIKKATPTKKIFDIIYEKQGGNCNINKKKISKKEGELHHKYIPQNLIKINYLWNLEILSHEEHKKIHKNKNLLINKLIKLGIFINKHKNFKKSIKYYYKKIYIYFKYKKS